MADSTALARERALTDIRVAEACALVAGKFGIDSPRQPQKFMDRRKMDLDRWVACAEFLESLAGSGEQSPVSEPVFATEPESVETIASDQPVFGPDDLPLSHFDEMSDEDIIALPGIGKSTLKHIHQARFDREIAEA